jgi:hypothetical protein
MKTVLVSIVVVALFRYDVEARLAVNTASSSSSCVRENTDHCGVLMGFGAITDS